MDFNPDFSGPRELLINDMLNGFSTKQYPFFVGIAKYLPEDADTEKGAFTRTLHRHDYLQVWYCRRGGCIHRVGENEFLCREGDVVIVPPGIFHAYSFARDCETELFCIDVTYFFFRRFEEELFVKIIANFFCHAFSAEVHFSPRYHIRLEGSEKETAEELFVRFGKEDWTKPTVNLRSVEQKIARLFSLLSLDMSEREYKYAAAFIKTKLSPIMDAILHINKNFGKKLYREELLKLSGICQTDFSRYFKRITGLPFSLYLQAIRLHKAHNMVSFSLYSFDYIADFCGFCDKMYMSKLYKKYYKFTMQASRTNRNDLIKTYPGMLMTRKYWERVNID